MINSLYARVVVMFVGSVIVSLVAGFLVQSYLYKNRVESIVEQKMIENAQMIIGLYQKLNPRDAKAFVDVSNSMPFYTIRLYDGEGMLLNPGSGEPYRQLDQPRLEQVLKHNKTYRGRSGGNDDITVGLPFLLNGAPYALLITTEVGFFLNEIDSLIKYQQLFLLGLGSILALIAARYLIRPLRLLTHAAQKMSKGDFAVGLPVKRRDEIGQLTHSFNVMANELGRLDKLRRRFVSDVSHEIQSPLTSIKGYTSVLKLKSMDEQSRIRMLNIIEEESDRLSRLCDDLLELSSLEHEYPKLDAKPFRLDEQLRQAVIRLEPLWSVRNLDMQLALEPINIVADEDKLNQVWSNLLGNGIKFTGDSGKITVEAYVKGRSAAVRITDSGIGIPKEEIGQIFKPFYKVDQARNRNISGNGIGLSIVKRIVDLHRGEIEVFSQPGTGTSFMIILPLQYVKPEL
ncbi:sensor histidine kinase [Paenibacillus azoreducens]|uniref:Heme sensor protein HssS n=1 Tax=Paenibacillus azoreducens TaxID=116718 RepID=A0A920CU96_9BACL|nr:HAMP domain-containing sensor histidine kinase [Paenibacillus azoreducens]GIO49197.1 two-component sensor histidine kinase [Paenibacillus azoreducens]